LVSLGDVVFQFPVLVVVYFGVGGEDDDLVSGFREEMGDQVVSMVVV